MLCLIPKPLFQQNAAGMNFVFSINTQWEADEFAEADCLFWQNRFISLLCQTIRHGNDTTKIVVKLGTATFIGLSEDALENTLVEEEGYGLVIEEKSVVITARKKAGLIWGLQTLYQLMYEQKGQSEIILAPICIEDAPRFKHRGFMLDVSRHFFGIEDIKKIINVLSMLKMNRFHWHLSDDQGWRVEIKRYPLLTEVGSFRRETMGDGRAHQGFYKQEEIRQIIRYANRLGVEIIPEIDLPGHFGAALAAYPELSCRKTPMQVKTTFGIFKDIVCGGGEETYRFIENVFDEICELFPCRWIHIGGDEAPKGNWKECPICVERMQREGLEKANQLQGFMLNRIARYLEEKGKLVIAWNDGVVLGSVDKGIIMQYWMGGRLYDKTVNEIKLKRSTIISDVSHFYFDYPHGMTNLKKAYNSSNDIENIKADILGLEAALWTEFVEDEKRMHYLLFPRLTAVAEKAWTMPFLLDFEDFKRRLEAFERILTDEKITGATVKEASVSGLRGFAQLAAHYKKVCSVDMIKALFETIRNKESD